MKKSLWIAGAVVAAGVIAVVAVAIYQWQLPRVRQRIETILSEQLGSQVQLADLSVSVGPTVRVSGGGLVLHHRKHPGVEFITIQRFDIDASLLTVLQRPYRIHAVNLEGLHIFIPPGDDDEAEAEERDGQGGQDEGAAGEESSGGISRKLGGPSPVVIGELVSSNALLEIGTSKPGREPKRFEIHDVRLRDFAFDRAVPFEANLTNPVPAGNIHTTGSFGPWAADEPSLTPVSGDYQFEDADLGTIDGIGGILDSTGAFDGRLSQIRVEGTTSTPEFSLEIGGQPVPLETTFTAIVDGTNGDTVLDPVEARLGDTPITATGGVVHVEGQKGRTISLDVTIDKGQLADVLHLALKEQPPPMSGVLTLKTKLEIPPGKTPVPEKLELDGNFTVEALEFASDELQDKIDDFSRRARGNPDDEKVANVKSAMQGRFQLRDGMLRLNSLSFAMRGAVVRLDGDFVLATKAIDFTGTVRMDARLSETMKTGWKSLLLKIVDPIFAKDGAGAVVPVKISGTASDPKFGLDVGKVF